MHLLILLLVILTTSCTSQKTLESSVLSSAIAPPPPPPTPDHSSRNWEQWDERAGFPFNQDSCQSIDQWKCSNQSLFTYMDREIDFERLENTADIERTCVVQFKVTKEGILEDIKIVRPVNPLADMEALRVVRQMNEIAGPWVPATYKGEAVSITFNLPVKFIRGYYAEKLAKE